MESVEQKGQTDWLEEEEAFDALTEYETEEGKRTDIQTNSMFLGATKHLYNWLCPLVGWSVGWLVGW